MIANEFECEVCGIASEEGICFVKLRCGEQTLGVMSLESGLSVGQRVLASFKESDVMLALDMRISARNKFSSPILSIAHNQILARVVLGFQTYQVISLISYEAVCELGLKEGQECIWFVKSNEILLRGLHCV